MTSSAHVIQTKKKIFHLYAQLKKSSVVKNFFIYSFGSLLLRGITIIIAPLTMSILSPADYGLIALANNFISMLAIFVGFGLRQAFEIEFFHCEKNKKATLINDILFLYIFLAVPIFMLMILNVSAINRYIFFNAASHNTILICLTSCFIYFFVELFCQVLKYDNKAWFLTKLQVIAALITISLNVIFLFGLKWGTSSILLAQLIGSSFLLCTLLLQYVQKTFAVNCSLLKRASTAYSYLKLGLPFVPGMLFAWVLASGDRWFLGNYTTLHNVGIYSLADTFGMLYQMIILHPINNAYVPYIFKKFSENKNNTKHIEQENKKNAVWAMIIGAVVVSAGYLVCKPLLYWFLPNNYHAVITYIWLILMSNVFLTGAQITANYIRYQKKTMFHVLSLLVAATVNCILNALLVTKFEIYGCIIATLIAYIIYFLITLWYNNFLVKKLSL